MIIDGMVHKRIPHAATVASTGVTTQLAVPTTVGNAT
ncbi:hypothetical protein DSM43519_05199 [Mycobacterium marinum]|nr:hypothetical protein DE4381_02339 [Mycobacterium marinum]RFZ15830.1 hypothetical protein DSM43519_05199 [Mycobacterium marinum]RFZ18205.1 hypothetical protein DSM44344_05001 [Mycobacterium marinum]RFZ45666.1 hypothetical protein KST_00398 [Mycobacterium marinum]